MASPSALGRGEPPRCWWLHHCRSQSKRCACRRRYLHQMQLSVRFWTNFCPHPGSCKPKDFLHSAGTSQLHQAPHCYRGAGSRTCCGSASCHQKECEAQQMQQRFPAALETTGRPCRRLTTGEGCAICAGRQLNGCAQQRRGHIVQQRLILAAHKGQLVLPRAHACRRREQHQVVRFHNTTHTPAKALQQSP